MWDILGILIVCSMVGVSVGGYLRYNLNKTRKFNQEIKDSGEEAEFINSLQTTSEEYQKVMDFMLMMGIIDFDTYNKLLIKGMGYTVQKRVKY